VLLERKIPIHGDENVELILRKGQQTPVRDPGLAAGGDCLHGEPGEMRRKPSVYALVEKHPHATSATASFAA
jgi:hypothetical protein